VAAAEMTAIHNCQMQEVQVKNIAGMNLLGLFITSIINRNLKIPEKYEQLKKLNCSILIKANKMKVTLHLKDGEISIERGAIPKPTAAVEGSLNTFLKVGLGKNILGLLVTRKIKIRGNPFVLLPLSKIIRV